MNCAPASTSAASSWLLDGRRRPWIDSGALERFARPAVFEPAPFVIRVRSRTVAKLRSVRFVVLLNETDGLPCLPAAGLIGGALAVSDRAANHQPVLPRTYRSSTGQTCHGRTQPVKDLRMARLRGS